MKNRIALLPLLWLLITPALSAQEVLSGYEGYWTDHETIDPADLFTLSTDELGILRNELFARRGRPFKSEKYQNYFRSQSWYREKSNYRDSWMDSDEMETARLIFTVERPASAGEELRRNLLKTMEFGKDESRFLLTFTGGHRLYLLDQYSDMAMYMPDSMGQEYEWASLGEWVLIEDFYGSTMTCQAFLTDPAKGVIKEYRSFSLRGNDERYDLLLSRLEN